MKYELEFVNMPLAVYREVAAHLRQVDGVDTGLLPQTSTVFDYNQSQVGGLWLNLADQSTVHDRQRIVQILNYYKTRYPLQSEDILTKVAQV
jgi:hypothetical protein